MDDNEQPSGLEIAGQAASAMISLGLALIVLGVCGPLLICLLLGWLGS